MPAYRHTKTGVLILVDAHTATFLSDEWVAEPIHGVEDPAPNPLEETLTDEPTTEVAETVEEGETTGTGAFAKTSRK